MSQDYDNTNRISVFKNTDAANERAPHWTGYIYLGDDVIEQRGEDGYVRVALWKTQMKERNGFFLSGWVQPPFAKDQVETSDDLDDDDF